MKSNYLQDVKSIVYLLFLCFCMLGLITGCKSIPQAETPQAVINQESEKQVPQTSFSLSETKKLPDLPAVQLEENIKQSQPAKLYTLCVRDADVRDVLMSLGKESNISIIVDPDIDIEKEPLEEIEIKDLSRGEYEESISGIRRGIDAEGAERGLGKQIQKRWTEKRRTRLVTADLKDVTLFEALDALLTPLRLEYKVEGNVIRVSKLCTITRIFHINYVITRRDGERTMSVGISGTESRTGDRRFAPQSGLAGQTGTREISVGGTNIYGLDSEDIFTEIETGLEGLGLISFGAGFGGIPEVEAGAGRAGAGVGREERFHRRRDWQREWRVESRSAGWEEAFTINRQAGTVLVTAFPDTIQKVAEYLETVEGSVHRQVLIQAKVIEVTLNDEFQYGINWDVIARRFKSPSIDIKQIPSPDISGIFQIAFTSRDLSALIEALSEQGKVNVLSSPKVSTLNNQKAIVNVGTQDVFFKVEKVRVGSDTSGNPVFQTVSVPFYVSLGVTLDVTPQINPSGGITMNIHPTVTEKLEDKKSPEGDVTAPSFTVREADTVIKARDGETVVIAGLMKDKERINEQKVPVLGNIPFLGWLFKNIKRTKEKTDLVILLTPTVTVGEPIETALATY
ncbi:MAG TPA: hypothetical protein VI387_02475 [Candidatus Brocadiales bacterium]|nr:hypothetical protein [Candidatus Brocadiales bacterium]